jgi:hypothetical protein
VVCVCVRDFCDLFVVFSDVCLCCMLSVAFAFVRIGAHVCVCVCGQVCVCHGGRGAASGREGVGGVGDDPPRTVQAPGDPRCVQELVQAHLGRQAAIRSCAWLPRAVRMRHRSARAHCRRPEGVICLASRRRAAECGGNRREQSEGCEGTGNSTIIP